jgi:hypothetical protein
MFDDTRACPGSSLSPLSKTIHHAIGLYYAKYVNDLGCDLDQRACRLLLRLNTSSRFFRVEYQKGFGGGGSTVGPLRPTCHIILNFVTRCCVGHATAAGTTNTAQVVSVECRRMQLFSKMVVSPTA